MRLSIFLLIFNTNNISIAFKRKIENNLMGSVVSLNAEISQSRVINKITIIKLIWIKYQQWTQCRAVTSAGGGFVGTIQNIRPFEGQGLASDAKQNLNAPSTLPLFRQPCIQLLGRLFSLSDISKKTVPSFFIAFSNQYGFL